MRLKKKKMAKFMAALLLASILFNGVNVANADSQHEPVSDDGVTIICVLDVSWHIWDNDDATAETHWEGRTGKQVKVKLLYAPEPNDDFKVIDTDYGDKGATVKASIASVYCYKSYHAVYDKNTKDAERVCTLTDV